MKALRHIMLCLSAMIFAGSCAGIHLLAEHYSGYLEELAEMLQAIN